MRLNEKEKKIIKEIVFDIFGESKIYLFGSRLDLDRKGGDIDLFIVSKEKNDLVKKKIKSLSKLERKLHKPVDIIVQRDFDREIEKEALKGKII